MKKQMMLCLCAVIGMNVLVAQTKNEKEIKAMMDMQVEAWNKGDVEGFMQGYWRSPDLTFIGSNGITKGWQQVTDNYKKNYASADAMGELHFSDLLYDKLGPASYRVTGSWHLKREKPADGWFTLIVKKIKNEWKIVYDHSS